MARTPARPASPRICTCGPARTSIRSCGAAATLYGAEKRPMEDFHELSGKGINWTFTAGIAGRFTTR